jgi:hypothetical protein
VTPLAIDPAAAQPAYRGDFPMTGPRQHRAYRAVLRRIAVLKDFINAAIADGRSTDAEAAHAELVDLECDLMLMERKP